MKKYEGLKKSEGAGTDNKKASVEYNTVSYEMVCLRFFNFWQTKKNRKISIGPLATLLFFIQHGTKNS